MAFALFNLYWSRGSQLVASAQTDSFGRLTTLRHALTLICPTMLSRLSPRAYRHDRVFVCACTHYLVFKEPTNRSARSASPQEDPSASLRLLFSRVTYLVYYLVTLLVKRFLLRFQTFFSKPGEQTVSPKSLVWKSPRFNLAVFPGNCKLSTSRMSLPIHQRYCDSLSVSAPKSALLGELDKITTWSLACQRHPAFPREISSLEQFGSGRLRVTQTFECLEMPPGGT